MERGVYYVRVFYNGELFASLDLTIAGECRINVVNKSVSVKEFEAEITYTVENTGDAEGAVSLEVDTDLEVVFKSSGVSLSPGEKSVLKVKVRAAKPGKYTVRTVFLSDGVEKASDLVEIEFKRPLRIEFIAVPVVAAAVIAALIVLRKRKVKYCVNCGRSIPLDARVCPYCGAPQP